MSAFAGPSICGKRSFSLAIIRLGRVDHSRGDPQIIIDKVVPIAGQPLDRGTLLVRVSEPRLNGSSEKALVELKGLVDTHNPAATNGTGALVDAATRGGSVPLELIVETEDAMIRLEPEPKPSVRLVPDLVGRLEDVLGEGSLRLVGGVSIEANADITKPRGPRRTG